MRTLLLDNHDSFTFNLFALLAQVNGIEPIVVRNDEPADRLPLDRVDAIVISPGPGHPAEPADIGLVADVLGASTLPVLGVCLGHEAMALAAGARIARAPDPVHGRADRVRHAGDPLFAAIPSEFAAVRYHSLAADRLPTDRLLATAWTAGHGSGEPEVIMALRHLSRPWWGVQFHPESIGTEHGRQLLANFRALAEGRAPGAGGGAGAARGSDTATLTAATGRTTAAGRPETAAPRPGMVATPTRPTAPAASPTGWHLHHLELPLQGTAEALFCALHGGAPHAFWLDSALSDGPLGGRFSFMGDAGGPHSEVLTAASGSGCCTVRSAGGERQVPEAALDRVGRLLTERRPAEAAPVPFAGGWVGLLGYELGGELLPVPQRNATHPDLALIWADRVLAVDHRDGRLHLLATSGPDAGETEGARRWLADTRRQIEALADAPPPPPPPPPTRADVTPLHFTLARGRARYLADIADCQEALRRGDSYEVCLTSTLTAPQRPEPLALHRTLRRVNPAPHAAFLRFGESLAVACSSPERLVSLSPDGQVQARPIKGTRARSTDEDRDRRAATELATSAKDRAENLMIVDLLRNDLSRVCEPSSVQVPRIMEVESYAAVHQLVSTIEGRLRPDAGAVDLVRACLPGGSMTGAPKVRTMQIIDRLEGAPRGVYAGAIGFLGADGAADLNVVIRTVVVTEAGVSVGAGGAIVIDSDPEAELAELLLKARAPMLAVARTLGIPGDAVEVVDGLAW